MAYGWILILFVGTLAFVFSVFYSMPENLQNMIKWKYYPDSNLIYGSTFCAISLNKMKYSKIMAFVFAVVHTNLFVFPQIGHRSNMHHKWKDFIKKRRIIHPLLFFIHFEVCIFCLSLILTRCTISALDSRLRPAIKKSNEIKEYYAAIRKPPSPYPTKFWKETEERDALFNYLSRAWLFPAESSRTAHGRAPRIWALACNPPLLFVNFTLLKLALVV